MAGLKSLAKDTAIYGMSSIIGRFLNYLLVPLYTAVLPAASGGYMPTRHLSWCFWFLVWKQASSVLPTKRATTRKKSMPMS